jgi:hypothetical protein
MVIVEVPGEGPFPIPPQDAIVPTSTIKSAGVCHRRGAQVAQAGTLARPPCKPPYAICHRQANDEHVDDQTQEYVMQPIRPACVQG